MKMNNVSSKKLRFSHLVIWLILFLFAVIIVFPILYIAFGSFKTNAELLVGGTRIFPERMVFGQL
jgi:ABC-type glycerol-3-phosphate transport system permease component